MARREILSLRYELGSGLRCHLAFWVFGVQAFVGRIFLLCDMGLCVCDGHLVGAIIVSFDGRCMFRAVIASVHSIDVFACIRVGVVAVVSMRPARWLHLASRCAGSGCQQAHATCPSWCLTRPTSLHPTDCTCARILGEKELYSVDRAPDNYPSMSGACDLHILHTLLSADMRSTCAHGWP